MAVAFSIVPDSFLLVADSVEHPATVTFTVTNLATVPARATVSVRCPDRARAWCSVAEPTRDLRPGTAARFTVTVRPDDLTETILELAAAVTAGTDAPVVSDPVVVRVAPAAPWRLEVTPATVWLSGLDWDPPPDRFTAVVSGPYGRRVRLGLSEFAVPAYPQWPVSRRFPPGEFPQEQLLPPTGWFTVERPERLLPATPDTFVIVVAPGAEISRWPPGFVLYLSDLTAAGGNPVATADVTLMQGAEPIG
ncbi:hypothetical protein AB0K00_48630 [Dactylosporangium sp. NPDC049525]|uniref:hypothetical protein n=1 Tax=Dactylosporangium sp. NPDC049525 TaxID=3154730 RepID=UPI0034224374